MRAKLLKGSQRDTSSGLKLSKRYNRKTLNEIIYEDLKAKILRGDISSDDKLQEDNLTTLYETSRTPIRDALRKLEQEGIIEKLYYGGYKIKELDIENIEEIFGIRSVLESYAAVLATRKITDAEIKEMDAILEKSKEAIANNDFVASVELNTKFHSCLYNASKSDILLKIIHMLWDYFYGYRKVIYRTRDHLENSYRDHQSMLEKMKEGDESAVENMVKNHVRDALCAFKEELKEELRERALE